MTKLDEVVVDCPDCHLRIHVPTFRTVDLRACGHRDVPGAVPDAVYLMRNPQTGHVFAVCTICERVLD